MIEIVDHFMYFNQAFYWANEENELNSKLYNKKTHCKLSTQGPDMVPGCLTQFSGRGQSLINKSYVLSCFFSCNQDDGAASVGRSYSWASMTGDSDQRIFNSITPLTES